MTAFPRLRIRRDAIEALGAFAESQADYLQPDAATVARLDGLLHAHNVGVVAHFYMDPQLQGVLAACRWPHIHISDSLVMADRAVQMAEAGVAAVVVAGVDFMSENVRAVLDAAGFGHVPVYRLARARIGCSLAEAAEAPAYAAFLQQASRQPRSLHVVYINTSLRVKAEAHARVPTITCTSSNVVQTILQAAAQIEDVHIWYGPDSYMGENLRTMLQAYAQLDAAAVARVHPQHTPASIASLLERFHSFEQGHCVVHHLFGHGVVEQVHREHPDAFITAHLEVPGEMFALAVAAQREGRGVVGSTSQILGFILDRVRSATSAVLPFVLGTEAGMVTSIVRGVQQVLGERGSDTLAVDIIFPVASDAIAATGETQLPLVPGSGGSEGCSTAGGCATCPYMKMNHLDALIDVVAAVGQDGKVLRGLEPQMDTRPIAGRSVAVAGGEPILHMRGFQRSGRIGDDLVADVLRRCG
jgi:quinolinate synthase